MSGPPPSYVSVIQHSVQCSRTSDIFCSTAGRVTCAVVDLPLLRRDLVTAPAVFAIGESHDILALLETYELTVTGTLEVVGSMVFEWYSCRKASNLRQLACRQGDGRGGDGVLDGCGWTVLCGCGEQHRCRRERGRESDEDHGCGDGVWLVRVDEVPVLYTSRCGLQRVSDVCVCIHCGRESHLRPMHGRAHACKAFAAYSLAGIVWMGSCVDGGTGRVRGRRWVRGEDGLSMGFEWNNGPNGSRVVGQLARSAMVPCLAESKRCLCGRWDARRVSPP